MPSTNLTLELVRTEDMDKFRVVSVIFSDQIFLSTGQKFVHVGSDTALRIRDSLIGGADVIVSEDKVNEYFNEPTNRLQYEDFTISIPDDLENQKRVQLKKYRSYLQYSTASQNVVDFYGFFTSFAKLVSSGYVITDENREEKYLEIINTGDEELIDALENYVECKDKIQESYNLYNTIITAIREVENAGTQEELDEAIANYNFIL